jgi:DNA-binding IclR family transcriptional regulator
MQDIINSVDRALDIIIYLYHEGKEKGISDIARDLGIYKSTVHRTLVTLEQKGFIYQNTDSGKYWLGVKIYAIGMAIGEKISLVEIIKPFTKQLFEEFKEVVNVSVLEVNSMDSPRSIVIHKEEDNRQLITVNPPIGSSSECHCSAVGKCLLAYGKDIPYERYIKRPLTKFTDNTIVDWDDFFNNLNKIKAQGYALDQEELEIGLTCIGAPVLDKKGIAIAAISLSGPTSRMLKGDFEYKIQRVKEIANAISNKFS